jgi:hypothetical protein
MYVMSQCEDKFAFHFVFQFQYKNMYNNHNILL